MGSPEPTFGASRSTCLGWGSGGGRRPPAPAAAPAPHLRGGDLIASFSGLCRCVYMGAQSQLHACTSWLTFTTRGLLPQPSQGPRDAKRRVSSGCRSQAPPPRSLTSFSMLLMCRVWGGVSAAPSRRPILLGRLAPPTPPPDAWLAEGGLTRHLRASCCSPPHPSRAGAPGSGEGRGPDGHLHPGRA